jgi:hypothetical protein
MEMRLMMPLTETLDRFTHTIPETGCHWYAGSQDRHGYGVIYRLAGGIKRSWLAHRVSYERHKGPIPDGLHILHSCDNPSCVNPDHLRTGTQADNNRDRDERGRQVAVKGEAHGATTITNEQAQEIREAAGTLKELGLRYGVHLSTISNIKRGKTWVE